MADQIIPLDNSPQQSFPVALNVDNAVLRLNLDIEFSEMAQYWTMSISDASGKLLLSSIPMLTGDWPGANMLAQYGYLAIGSAFLLNSGQVNLDYPDATSLGNDFFLLWGDTQP